MPPSIKVCHRTFFIHIFLKLNMKIRMVLNYPINMFTRNLKNMPQAKTLARVGNTIIIIDIDMVAC